MTDGPHERVFVFERFSDQGRHVLVLAQVEARLLAHSYVGPEHILLGIIHDGGNVAAAALAELGVTLDSARKKVEETVGPSSDPGASEYPVFSSRAKNVLESSLREAQELGHGYIGPEHMLLSLVHDGTGVSAEVLVGLGAPLAEVGRHVTARLPRPGDSSSVGDTGMAPVGPWSHDAFAPGASSGASGADTGWRGACSFCGRDLRHVPRYVAVGAAAICQDCVTAAASTLENRPGARPGTCPPGGGESSVEKAGPGRPGAARHPIVTGS